MEGILQLHRATGKTDEDNCADEDPFFQRQSALRKSHKGDWMDGSRRGLEFTSRFDLPIDLRILESMDYFSRILFIIEDHLFCIDMSPASYLSRYTVVR